MGWCAETDQAQLDCGTLLSIFLQPWQHGDAPHPPSPGASVLLRFNSGAAATFTVIEVLSDYSVIQTSDKTKWKMVEATLQQRALAAGTGDAPATYWVVQNRI
jgi:hypothetical protein